MKTITNDQIIAMNTLLADYVVKTTVLQCEDTDLIQYISVDTHPSILHQTIKTANENGLECYIVRKGNMLVVTSWIK